MSAEASIVTQVEMDRKTARKRAESDDPFAVSSPGFVPPQESFLAAINLGAVGPMMVLLALIGGLGYGGWSLLQEVQRVKFAPVEAAPVVTASVEAPVIGDTIIAAVEQSSGFVAPSSDALDRLYRPAALEVPVMAPRDGPISALDSRNMGAFAPVIETASAVAPEADIATPVEEAAAPVIQVSELAGPEVSIIAVRPSWVRIKSAGGSVIFEKVMAAGEMYTLPKTEEPPLMRTGYAGAIYFAVNGQTYGPAGVGATVAKKVALGEADIQDSFAVADLAEHEELAVVVASLATQNAVVPAE
jgi:hypothetical protein